MRSFLLTLLLARFLKRTPELGISGRSRHSSTMAALVRFSLFVVVLLCGGYVHGENNNGAVVYDVTKYGASPGSKDNKRAFLAAWRAACGGSTAGNLTVRVPEGAFVLGAVEFSGPCRNDAPIAVVIDGVLRPCTSDRCHVSADDDAWITFSHVSNLLVTGAGTLDGQGAGTGAQSRKHKTNTLVLDGVASATLRGLAFMDSRGFHVSIHRSAHVSAQSLRITAPATSRNTDGIHVGFSNHVSILGSAIGTGDDCVSIGPGCTDVLVSGVACGPGHGISVGSLGKGGANGGDGDVVRGVVVRNCTVRGTANGVRIKTWPGPSSASSSSAPAGGSASNITFEDVAMAGVENPIVIDQHYCPHGSCGDARGRPSLVQISCVTFRGIRGTASGEVAVRLRCSETRPCSGARLDGVDLRCFGGSGEGEDDEEEEGRPCKALFENVAGKTPGMQAMAPNLRVNPVDDDDEEEDRRTPSDAEQRPTR